MGLHKGRLIALALAAALSGGLIACDSSSTSETEVAEEGSVEQEEVETADAEPLDIDLEALPFHASGPIATIDGTEITANEFNQFVAQNFGTSPPPLPPNMMHTIVRQVVDSMVNLHLIETSLDEQGFEITEEDLDSAFEEIRAGFPNDEMFRQELAARGLTVSEVRERIRPEVRLDRYLRQNFDLEVSEADVVTTYAEHEEALQPGTEVHARHILVRLDPATGQEGELQARARAQEIYDAARADGADFEQLARERSESPTAEQGGDLGYLSRGQFVEEFMDVALAMEPGQISEPVRSAIGFHVIQVVDKREGERRSLEDVRERLTLQLQEAKLVEALQGLVEGLREGRTIVMHDENIEINMTPTAQQQIPQPQMQRPQQQMQPPQLQAPTGTSPTRGGSDQGGRQLQLDPSLQR